MRIPLYLLEIIDEQAEITECSRAKIIRQFLQGPIHKIIEERYEAGKAKKAARILEESSPAPLENPTPNRPVIRQLIARS